MTRQPIPSIYNINLFILLIITLIRRRILARSESSISQTHDVIQIALGWSDSHLNRFRIHGRDYGLSRPGGIGFSHDAAQVSLADLQFRRNEGFLHEYDFGDSWQHEVGIEAGLPEGPKRGYPVCVGG
jgi:hypothetical protein